ncbi:hypothetical protein ARMGADRAFT_1016071, partial [Armillaria gallica]
MLAHRRKRFVDVGREVEQSRRMRDKGALAEDGSKCPPSDANDILEVALDAWVRVSLFERFGLAHVPHLDLHSGCLSEEWFTHVSPSIRVFGTSLL